MNSSSTSLENPTNYRLIEISKIKDYFTGEIQYQQSLTNKLSKYWTILDYVNKTLTVFLTVFSSTNIFTHVKTDKKLLGRISSVFSLVGTLFYGIVIKLKEKAKSRKKKNNRLLYMCKNKLDCIEMLITDSIKDGIIDHDEFLEIIKEKENSMIV